MPSKSSAVTECVCMRRAGPRHRGRVAPGFSGPGGAGRLAPVRVAAALGRDQGRSPLGLGGGAGDGGCEAAAAAPG
eukprot:3672951-Rhodomonas_salina.1